MLNRILNLFLKDERNQPLNEGLLSYAALANGQMSWVNALPGGVIFCL